MVVIGLSAKIHIFSTNGEHFGFGSLCTAVKSFCQCSVCLFPGTWKIRISEGAEISSLISKLITFSTEGLV